MRKQIILIFGFLLLVSCTVNPSPAPTIEPSGEVLPSNPSQPLNTESPLNPEPSPISTLQPGETRIPLDPANANLNRASVFIDSTQLLLLESYPPQINLIIAGSLPTPCHQLRVVLNDPDELNRINVEVYSVVDAEAICIQVLEPFEETVSLGSFPSGTYQVFVNGEEIGEFDS